jgi:hypothetical protein
VDAFDQAAWERTTTWEGQPPSPGELWGLLHDPELPPRFHEVVDRCTQASSALKAGLAQHAAAPGGSDEEVARLMGAVTGRRHPASVVGPLLARKLTPAAWKVRFTNLVSGRFTELVFERAFRPRLESLGLNLAEETTMRSFLDYRITDGSGFELAVNLKNAGVQYRDSKRWVGLDPEDTLPIATYKIFGSELAGIPPLIYVYLVDWTLLERLRLAYWEALSENERQLFQVLACTRGLPRDVEDAFIESTVQERLDQLVASVGYDRDDLTDLPFRAISAGRCRRLFFDQHERSPYVYRQRMNTDPNVHISVAAETLPFAEFVDRFLTSAARRDELLQELSRTKQVTIPAPSV